jgi:uncharacterized OB-fold protein
MVDLTAASASADVTHGAEIPPPPRALPFLNKDSVEFWTAGERGELRIFRCQRCEYYVHPPVDFCPQCESRTVQPETVSGRGEVVTYTIVRKQFVPGLPVPYVIALVGLDEQRAVQLPTNIRNCPPESVHIGMKVKVFFEPHGDLWIPFFEPVDEA